MTQYNLFEEEYKPSKLRNWEIPKWFPDRPCGNTGKTPVISNERGHLLPGVPRSQHNPWGDFVSTWDLPKKIDRQLANKLSAPRKDKIIKWKRHCQQQGGPLPQIPKILAEDGRDEASELHTQITTEDGDVCLLPRREHSKPAESSHQIVETQLCPIHDI